ncbi:hypothetical protein QQ020_25230 [Fulvivirgaceae bacterium BMA12]|uniref:Bacterial Pleckstrin homology domain-containing protein n=1 Tax=Agaribacillus aureus TaxID=3051825 RepID=A0ABT8LCC2_9BACT|nr:hypothetical protein [Fulvivirgaceae bacterium BMA12]
MSRILFSENQRFTQVWLVVVMIVSNLTVAVPLGWGFYVQIITGEPWGNNPMSDMGLIIVILLSFSMMAIINMIIFGAKLEVQIKDNSVYYKYFPFIPNWKYVHKDNIANYEMKQFKAIKDYGGYGYRKNFFKKLTGLIIKGNHGLLLTFHDDRKLMIGTQQPEAMKQAMQRIMEKDTDY